MAELVFPLAALALVFLVAIPGLTALSWLALRRARRRQSWSAFGASNTFAWLTAPVALPLTWLISSAAHQSEPSRAGAACLVSHGSPGCTDAMLLLAITTLTALGLIAWRLWRDRAVVALEPLPAGHQLASRVARMVDAELALSAMRWTVLRKAPAPVFAMGLLRPRVCLDACFVASADDAMLRAALLHESAHVRGRDNLRDVLVRVCLALNPVGRWLAADFARWQQAREAQCDLAAIRLGGEPLALAEGIVRAARMGGAEHQCLAQLCGHRSSTLKLRLALLMTPPAAPHTSWGHGLLAVALVLAAAAPHLTATGLLDVVHLAVERLIPIH
jgi:Zn-dependent protease with chaperone function